MKAASRSLRYLSAIPRPNLSATLDRPLSKCPQCQPGMVRLTASPIATSSRVTLPMIRDRAMKSTHERFHESFPRSPSTRGIGTASPRGFSTSARTLAQPLERPWDHDGDDELSSYSGRSRWRDTPTLSPDEISVIGEEREMERYRHFVPPEVPPDLRHSNSGGVYRVKKADAERVEYQPTEADFVAEVEDTADNGDLAWDGQYADIAIGTSPNDIGHASFTVDPHLEATPDSRGLDREAQAVSPERRTLEMQDLPILEPGQPLEDGQTRYDWRKQALSQVRRAQGARWFPEEQGVRRDKGKVVMLEEGDKLYAEVKRYSDNFKPLLEAEHKEEQRLHAERQLLWDPEKLAKEGFMVENLGASLYPVKKHSGYIYTFYKTGRDAARRGGDMGFHKFTPGTVTEICRTHPHHDYVKEDGNIQSAEGGARGISKTAGTGTTPLLSSPLDKLLGSVYSTTKKYIRVAFDTSIHDIGTGRWRLDIGCNDIALERQLAAIDLLHVDPTETERQDAFKQASTTASYDLDDTDSSAIGPRRSFKQTVLQGTNLRDKLLWAFQGDNAPDHTAARGVKSGGAFEIDSATPGGEKPPLANTIMPAHHLRPEDIDATPIPSPHPRSDPGSFLDQNQLIASWTKRYRADTGRPPVQIEGDPVVSLNQSQTRAIAMMLSERLSLVQGPPGTGKTRVIIETIKLLKHHWRIPHPILVTAHTNAAVDNLLAGLRSHGVKAARLGREEVVRDDLRKWTVERQMERHPLYRRWDGLVKDKEGLENDVRSSTGAERVRLIEKKSEVQKKLYPLKTAIMRDVLLDNDVICTTCLSAASRSLDQIDFPIVFLDEASMATEPLSLVPLMKGSSNVAIIGDHKQLPPIITSEAAQVGGLATSLFERLIHERHVPSIMLDTQYRMHPQIAAFANRAFYASALNNGTARPNGTVRKGLESPDTAFLVDNARGERQNVTFVHHDSLEDPSSKSIRNEGEAGRVCDVVADLLYRNPKLKGSDIGIITPYAAQIRQLDQYLHTDPERADAFLDLLGSERVKELENIEIKTVDGFEGREKEVIIFSTVRNNPGRFIGFLADWRRLNVGLTRAKRALIIIGSADHLAQAKIGKRAAEILPSGGAKIWREFMAWLNAEGLILREDDI